MSVATRLFDVLKEIKDTLVTKASTQYVDEQIAQVGGGLTAAQILAELKTVDGSTSGLDSDLLDAQHGSYYLSRANHTGTQSADSLTDGSTNKAYTATEKTKLAGIEAGANNYTHPATHSADIITDGSTNKAYTATEKTKLAGIGAVFIGYKNSTTAIANATDVLIASDTTYANTDASVYSLSGGLITVLKAGTYLISSLASISSGSDNTRMLTIVYVNGSPIIYAGQNGQILSKISRVVGTVALNLAANDTVGVYFYQDSGASKTCNAGINGNYINIAKIG